jgi:Uncharacterized conserved protein
VGIQKKWQKHRTVEIISKTISAQIVVCTLHWAALERHHLTTCLGTPLYGYKVKPDGVPEGTIVVRAGIFDDIEILNEHKPQVEIYTDGRVEWMTPIEEAGQFVGMPPLPSSDDRA